MKTNRDRAEHPTPVFQESCRLAHIPTTRRQASKWKMHKGKAYAHRNEAKRSLAEKQRQQMDQAVQAALV